MDPRLQWTAPQFSQQWPPDTIYQHVHLYKGDNLQTGGARNYRRQRGPDDHKQPITYRTNLTIVGLLVFFILTTTAAVTVLLLRELSRRDGNLELPVKVIVNSEMLMSAYPGMFRTTEQQDNVINTEPKLKPVKRLVKLSATCSVSCDASGRSTPSVPTPTTQPVTMNPTAVRATMMSSNITGVSGATRLRDKRSSPSYAVNSLYHGCCVSNFYHIMPSTLKNIEGHHRTLVQLPNAMQMFQIENCSQAIDCVGCTCMTDQVLTTAVVLKADLKQTAGTTMDDLEIQKFYFDGCCKCLNVGSNN